MRHLVLAAVPLLLTAANGVDTAVLAAGGRRNHLAAVWRTEALRTALSERPEVRNAAFRELYAAVRVADVLDDRGWGQDCDTWDDIEQARARAATP